MQRRTLLTAGGTITATALAGCLGSSEDDDPADGDDSERTITVSESGEVDAEPDLAVVRVAVEATGENAADVRDDLAERGDALYDALVEYGIDEDAITTDEFNIRDTVDERQMHEDGVEPQSEEDLEPYVYYEGTNAFRIDVEDVGDVGNVIDTAVDAGADSVGRIEFTLSDEKREELRQDALEEAIDAADAEAEFIAGQVDAAVIEAKHVDTSGGRISPVHEEYEAADGDDAAAETTLRPDDVTVRATVDVQYTIE